MFTGLIQETGRIVSVRKLAAQAQSSAQTRITVASAGIATELKTGDSVAVSGVCLTAVEILDGQFSADLAAETLQRTSLGRLQPGSTVNLELPTRAQDRLGGHVVQGHADGVGRILSLARIKGGEDWRLAIEIPNQLSRYVVPQGSISVEGISLTVAQIRDNRVEIAIIPHTYQATNLHALRAGDPVNIEVDVLAKYAEKTAHGTSTMKLSVAELLKQGF